MTQNDKEKIEKIVDSLRHALLLCGQADRWVSVTNFDDGTLKSDLHEKLVSAYVPITESFIDLKNNLSR